MLKQEENNSKLMQALHNSALNDIVARLKTTMEVSEQLMNHLIDKRQIEQHKTIQFSSQFLHLRVTDIFD